MYMVHPHIILLIAMKVHVPDLLIRVILYYSSDLFHINVFFWRYFIIWHMYIFFKEYVFSTY